MECHGCRVPTKPALAIKCTTDGCGYIFCSLCINVATITKERKKTWRCPDCLAATRKGGDNSLTPAKSGSDSENITVRKKAESLPGPSAPDASSEISKLTVELRQLARKFATLGTRLEEVTVSLTHCHGQMDDLVSSIRAMDDRIKTLEKRDQEVITLRATVSDLNLELNVQAQYSLRNEVEIIGIPETASENLDHIVRVASMKLGVELADGDVDYITRVGARRPPNSLTPGSAVGLPDRAPRPIVVRLLRRAKRDQILQASKSRRNLTSADLEVSGAPLKLFFNERLTKQNRGLFREARSRAKIHGYLYCWCNNGSIYIREREGKAAVSIRMQSDLDRLLPTGSGPDGVIAQVH